MTTLVLLRGVVSPTPRRAVRRRCNEAAGRGLSTYRNWDRRMIHSRTSRIRTTALAACVCLGIGSSSAAAQLRVVTYNTTGGPREGLATVLQAIGEDHPIDVLALQEQHEETTPAIVELLN